MMKNIFVNFEDGAGVMVFTENEKITPEIVEKGFKYKGFDILETYEVPTDDLQYYIFDPLWLTPEKEEVLLGFAEKYKKPWQVKGIVWDTDGGDPKELDLPTEVEVPGDVEEDEIADWLSEEYGYCVESYALERED